MGLTLGVSGPVLPKPSLRKIHKGGVHGRVLAIEVILHQVIAIADYQFLYFLRKATMRQLSLLFVFLTPEERGARNR